MKLKIEELKKARELRQEGCSVREIAKILNVSKGSVSGWVRDIKLSKKQYDRLISNWKIGQRRGCYLGSKTKELKHRELRRLYQQEGEKKAESKNADFYSGCMLYWAEGSKSKHTCQLTNSDPNMLRYFISFLKNFFLVKDEDIKIRCHYYTCSGISNLEIEKYWGEQLKMPSSCFVKTTVNNIQRKSDHKRQERTKYGVAKVIVGDVRIVQMIYGAIQKIGGFKNEQWLS